MSWILIVLFRGMRLCWIRASWFRLVVTKFISSFWIRWRSFPRLSLFEKEGRSWRKLKVWVCKIVRNLCKKSRWLKSGKKQKLTLLVRNFPSMFSFSQIILSQERRRRWSTLIVFSVVHLNGDLKSTQMDCRRSYNSLLSLSGATAPQISQLRNTYQFTSN